MILSCILVYKREHSHNIPGPVTLLRLSWALMVGISAQGRDDRSRGPHVS